VKANPQDMHIFFGVFGNANPVTMYTELAVY